MKPQARKNSALGDPQRHAGMKPEVVKPRAIRGDYLLSFGPYVSSSGTVPDMKRRSCRQGRRRSRGGHLAEAWSRSASSSVFTAVLCFTDVHGGTIINYCCHAPCLKFAFGLPWKCLQNNTRGLSSNWALSTFDLLRWQSDLQHATPDFEAPVTSAKTRQNSYP